MQFQHKKSNFNYARNLAKTVKFKTIQMENNQYLDA